MFAKLFKSEIYVQIYPNRISLRLVRERRDLEVVPDQPFTSNRLLVGDFTTAERLLAGAVKNLIGSRLFAPAPSILMHPMEMVEGGLSQIEERVFLELGHGARGRIVKVYLGPKLSDEDVIAKLRER